MYRAVLQSLRRAAIEPSKFARAPVGLGGIVEEDAAGGAAETAGVDAAGRGGGVGATEATAGAGAEVAAAVGLGGGGGGAAAALAGELSRLDCTDWPLFASSSTGAALLLGASAVPAVMARALVPLLSALVLMRRELVRTLPLLLGAPEAPELLLGLRLFRLPAAAVELAASPEPSSSVLLSPSISAAADIPCLCIPLEF